MASLPSGVSPDAGYVNMGKMLEFVLHNGVDPSTGKLMGLQTGDPRDFKNIDDLKDALRPESFRSLCESDLPVYLPKLVHP